MRPFWPLPYNEVPRAILGRPCYWCGMHQKNAVALRQGATPNPKESLSCQESNTQARQAWGDCGSVVPLIGLATATLGAGGCNSLLLPNPGVQIPPLKRECWATRKRVQGGNALDSCYRSKVRIVGPTATTGRGGRVLHTMAAEVSVMTQDHKAKAGVIGTSGNRGPLYSSNV